MGRIRIAPPAHAIMRRARLCGGACENSIIPAHGPAPCVWAITGLPDRADSTIPPP
jgi:hypothetical protein